MSTQFTTLHKAVSAYLNILGFTRLSRGMVFPYVRAISCTLRSGNCVTNVHVYCISINTHFTPDANYYHGWHGYDGSALGGVLQYTWITSSVKYVYNYVPYLGIYHDES